MRKWHDAVAGPPPKSGGDGFVVGTAAGQNFGFRTEPVLLGVSRFASTFFVEFVGAPADFFHQRLGI